MKPIQVYDSHFTHGVREMRLTTLQALKLKLCGEVKAFNGRPEDWTGAPGEVPFYVTKCPKHGYYLAYEAGYEKALRCPSCLQELVEASGLKGVERARAPRES